jgi:TP901 family phage tail tape measure protein
MALKINITAQISNLKYIREQIQKSLQNVEFKIGGSSKVNTQVNKINADEDKARLQRLKEYNAELNKYLLLIKTPKKSGLTNDEFTKNTKALISLMEKEKMEVNDLIAKYGGYRNALIKIDQIKSKEISDQIKVNQIRKQGTEALKLEQAAMKGTSGNDALNRMKEAERQARSFTNIFTFSKQKPKDIQEYINSMNKLVLSLNMAGIKTKEMTGEYTRFGQALKNTRKLQDDLKNAKDPSTIQAQNMKNLSNELTKLNRHYKDGSQTGYREDTLKIIQAMKAEGFSFRELLGNLNVVGIAYKNLNAIKKASRQTTDPVIQESQRIKLLSEDLIKLNNLYKSGDSKNYKQQADALIATMISEKTSFTNLLETLGSVRTAYTNLNNIKKETNKANDPNLKQAEHLKVLSVELGKLNNQYKSLEGVMPGYKAQTQNVINSMIKEGTTFNKLLAEMGTVRTAYTNLKNIKKEVAKTNDPNLKNAEQLKILSTELNKLNNQYKSLKGVMPEYKNQTQNIIDAMIRENATFNQLLGTMGTVRTAYKNLKDAKNEAKKAKEEPEIQKTQKLEQELNKLNELYRKGIIGHTQYSNSIKQMKTASNDLSGVNQKLITQTKVLETISAFKQGKITASEYNTVIKGIISNTEKMIHLDSKTLALIKQMDTAVNKSQSAFSKYFSNMGMVMKKVSDWLVGTTLIYAPINELKKAVTYVIEMDDALTELNKVTNMSSVNLENMKNNAISLGKSLGVSSVEIMKSMAEFGRIRKDPEQITELAKYAAMASKITTLTAQDAAKSFNTTMILYKKDVKDVEHILDSLNEIQNNFRTSAEDMTDGIDKIGAAAQQTGVQMENLEGYITAIVSATGLSGSEAGTALKSIISRVYRIGEEGAESDGKAMEALKGVGVEVTQLNGEFRDFDTVLAELSDKWKDMSTAQKQNIAQAVAGTYHYSKFISLMENFNIATKATNTALNSSGSSISEYNKYLDSLSGRIGKLTVTIESKFNQLINTQLFKEAITVVNTLTGAFGDLESIVVVVTAAIVLLYAADIQLIILNSAKLVAGIGLFISTMIKEGVVIKTLTGGFKALTLAMLENPVVILTIAFVALYSIMKLMKESEEEAKQARIDRSKAMIEEAAKVNKLKSDYMQLNKLNDGTTDSKDKLLAIQKELIAIYGEEAKKLDLVNGKYKDQIKILEKAQAKKGTGTIESTQKELDNLNSQNAGTPTLEKGNIFDSEKVKISNIGNDKVYSTNSGVIKSQNIDLQKRLDILEKQKKVIEESGDKEIKAKELLFGKNTELIAKNAIGLKSDKDKQAALKTINDEYDKTKKELGEVNALHDQWIDSIKIEIESGVTLNDIQKKLYDMKSSKIDQTNIVEFRKNLKGLMKDIESQKIESLGDTYSNLNQRLSQGKISVDEYNKKMKELRNTISSFANKEQAADLFKFTTEVQPTIESLEDLTKAAQDNEKEFDSYKTNLDGLSDAYGKLLAGQNLDINTKLALVKAYPQLTSVMNNNKKLLETIGTLYKKIAEESKTAFSTMLESDFDFYQNSLKNNEDYFANLEDKYGIDLDSYVSFLNLKENAMVATNNVLGEKATNDLDTNLKLIKAQMKKVKESMKDPELSKGFKLKIADNYTELKQTYGELLAVQKIIGTINEQTGKINTEMEAKAFEEVAKVYDQNVTDILANLNDLGEALTSLQKGDHLTTETLMKLVEQYPQLASVMGNEKQLLNELTKLHGTEANAAVEAYRLKLETSTSFYTNLSKQNETFWSSLANAYGVDLKNYATYTQAKQAMDTELIARYAGVDWEKNIGNTIKIIEDQFTKLNTDKNAITDVGLGADLTKVLGQLKAIDYLNKKVTDITKNLKFDKFGFDPKTTKEQSEQTIVLTERYAKLNAELAVTNSLIDKNRTLQENAKGQKLIDLLYQEDVLLKRKKQNILNLAEAHRKEAREIENSLMTSGKGFTFTGTGDNKMIANSKVVLDRLAKELNAHRKDTDQKVYDQLKKEYDRINTLVERHYEIQFSNITEFKKNNLDADNEIIENAKSRTEEYVRQLNERNTLYEKSIEKLNQNITDNAAEAEIIDDKDFSGKIANMNSKLKIENAIIKEISKEIKELKSIQTKDPEFQKQINLLIEEKNKLLKESTSEIKKTEQAIKDEKKAWDDYNKNLVETNVGKYVKFLNKLMNDEKEKLKNISDERQKAFDLFKDQKTAEIKKLEEQADATNVLIDREQKLADLRKQQALIANLKKERTQKVYKEGEGWIWTADLSKIADEQDKLKDMTTDYNQWENKNVVEAKKKSLQKEIDDAEKVLNTFKDSIDTMVNDIDEGMSDIEESIENNDYIKSWGELLKTFTDNKIPGEYFTGELDKIKTFFTDFQNILDNTDLDMSGFTSQIINLAPTQLKPEIAQSIINNAKLTNKQKQDKMKENSEKWKTADSVTKKSLEDENQKLGISMGWTRRQNGSWYDKDGKLMYGNLSKTDIKKEEPITSVPPPPSATARLIDVPLIASNNDTSKILVTELTKSVNKFIGAIPTIAKTQVASDVFNVEAINVITNSATDFVGNLKKIIYKRGA